MMGTRFVTLAMLVATAFLLAPVGAGAASLDEYRERGVVRGAFVNEVPYGYIGRDGKVTGEAPEIARIVLERIGIDEFEGKLTEWPSLLPGLEAGRWDVIAAGMYITPERCEQALFTEPTYRIGQSFLVQANNPRDLHSYDDVRDNPGVTLGVMAGAVERDYAARADIPDRQIEEIPTQEEMLAAVRTGRVDAVALSTISIRGMAEEGGDAVEQVDDFDTPDYAVGYGGFAFRPGDEELHAAFNEALVDFIGSAEHLELMERFGFTEENLPGDVTRDALCAGEVSG